MELDIRAQALSLGLALALGAGLGLLYDLLRPIRRHGGSSVWDALFCLCAAAAAFLFAMRAPNGVLGSGEVLLSLFGLLLYFQLLSPVFLPIFVNLDRTFGVIWIFTQNSRKKVLLSAKKLFQNLRE